MIFGTGFAPHRGGPIQTIRARGKDEWLEVMAELKVKHGLRFEPDTGLGFALRGFGRKDEHR